MSTENVDIAADARNGSTQQNNTEIATLREKLNLLEQIQDLQSQLNVTDSSLVRPAMHIKPPEGSYSCHKQIIVHIKKM